MDFTSEAQNRGKMGMSLAFDSKDCPMGHLLDRRKLAVDFVKFIMLHDPWTI